MKGSYVLIIRLDRSKRISIGKIGIINFRQGYYAYIGSAMNGLESRIGRHLREEKKVRWHIDYLLRHASIDKVFYKESKKKEECMIARKFAERFDSVPRFGASDCDCDSHLFYSPCIKEFEKVAKTIGMKEWHGQIF